MRLYRSDTSGAQDKQAADENRDGSLVEGSTGRTLLPSADDVCSSALEPFADARYPIAVQKRSAP